MTREQILRWLDLRRLGQRLLRRAGGWLRRFARTVRESPDAGGLDWLPGGALRHRVGDYEIGVVGPEPPLPTLSDEDLARLRRVQELLIDPAVGAGPGRADFPLETYLGATAPWREASCRWMHRVSVDREPTRLFVETRHPEVRLETSEPSALLVYGRPVQR